MKTLGIALSVVAATASTAAARDLTVVDHGDYVAVTIPGVALTDGRVGSRGDRVIVGLTRTPPHRFDVPVDDPMVKSVRLQGGKYSSVSVQLRHGRAKTQRIGGAAVVASTSTGVVVSIPRFAALARWNRSELAAWQAARRPAAPIAAPDAPVAAGPATAAVAATAKLTAPTPAPTPAPAATVAGERPTAAPADPKTDAQTATEAAAGTTAIASPGAASNESSPLTTIALFIVLIGGCAAAVWFARKRRSGIAADQMLNVLASCDLGGKSRVVLMSAPGREVLLSVGDNGPSLIGQWSTERLALPAPAPESDREPPRPPVALGTRRIKPIHDAAVTEPVTASSPAVAGLIRLRDRTPSIADEVSTGDPIADAEWARELLAATRRGGAA